jgi:hypothetical protein
MDARTLRDGARVAEVDRPSEASHVSRRILHLQILTIVWMTTLLSKMADSFRPGWRQPHDHRHPDRYRGALRRPHRRTASPCKQQEEAMTPHPGLGASRGEIGAGASGSGGEPTFATIRRRQRLR